jgi:hypothetical protein
MSAIRSVEAGVPMRGPDPPVALTSPGVFASVQEDRDRE